MTTAKDLKATMPGWLNNTDVEEFAAGQNLTITFAGPKQVGQETEPKNVLLFAEIPKGLVLNNNCVDALDQLFGSEGLLGKTIQIELIEVRGRDIKTVIAAK